MVLCEEISQNKDVHRVIAKLLDIHFRYRFEYKCRQADVLVVDNISWPLPAGNYISGICNKLDTLG